MSFGEKMRWVFFGEEPAKHDFAATPIIDSIEVEQYGTALLPIVSREEALSVPGIMHARNSLCSLASLPLKTYDAEWNEVDNPLFRQIDPTRTNNAVKSDTLEDMWLYAVAYWRVLARMSDGYPASAEYVSFKRVLEQVQKDGSVEVFIDGKREDWSNVIKFEGPNPALLKYGGRVVKRALDLDVTAAKYARNPRPLDYFTPDMDVDPLDDKGIRAFLQKWKLWLRSNVTGYVPAGMKYVSVDQPNPKDLELIASQAQVNLNIANMTGIDPEELGISVTSRTYFNAEDRNQTKIKEFFSPFMAAFCERLSMWDVTKRGHQVFFDQSNWMKADEATRATVQIARRDAGLLTDEEIRADEHRPALPPAPEKPKEEPDGNNEI